MLSAVADSWPCSLWLTAQGGLAVGGAPVLLRGVVTISSAMTNGRSAIMKCTRSTVVMERAW